MMGVCSWMGKGLRSHIFSAGSNIPSFNGRPDTPNCFYQQFSLIALVLFSTLTRLKMNQVIFLSISMRRAMRRTAPASFCPRLYPKEDFVHLLAMVGCMSF